MNVRMAYLLGMIAGNGEIQRGKLETTISLEIPHKKMQTDFNHDVGIYVRASITDIRDVLEPLIGTNIGFMQNERLTILSFRKKNDEYLNREILRYIGNASSHENIRLHEDIFNFSYDEKVQFLKGFADVTGYIRRSNYFFEKFMHRVYLEIPHNWELVIDICNLLKSVDIPVQNIDWAHPNMRDPKVKKYNEGQYSFWKKEHQIKIWANEFIPIGFAVLHKMDALEIFASELIEGVNNSGKDVNSLTHQYYWESQRMINKRKPTHPAENDVFIPSLIRGKHFESWKKIARELGYRE